MLNLLRGLILEFACGSITSLLLLSAIVLLRGCLVMLLTELGVLSVPLTAVDRLLGVILPLFVCRFLGLLVRYRSALIVTLIKLLLSAFLRFCKLSLVSR